MYDTIRAPPSRHSRLGDPAVGDSPAALGAALRAAAGHPRHSPFLPRKKREKGGDPDALPAAKRAGLRWDPQRRPARFLPTAGASPSFGGATRCPATPRYAGSKAAQRSPLGGLRWAERRTPSRLCRRPARPPPAYGRRFAAQSAAPSDKAQSGGAGNLWVRLERTYTMELTHVKHRLYRIPT